MHADDLRAAGDAGRSAHPVGWDAERRYARAHWFYSSTGTEAYSIAAQRGGLIQVDGAN